MEQDNALRRLDELIADLGGADAGMRTVSPCGLLLEHLRAARSALLGSMRAEYCMSLEQAKESVACVADKSARNKTKERVRNLIDSSVPKQRSVAAGEPMSARSNRITTTASPAHEPVVPEAV
jgi:hypothetical protein